MNPKKIFSHTPGPWNVWDGPEYVGGGEDLCIGAGGDKWIANMDHPLMLCECGRACHPVDIARNVSIASLGELSDRITGEQRANATLMAASPELLGALQNLVDSVRGGDPREIHGALEGAQEILWKAQGLKPVKP